MDELGPSIATLNVDGQNIFAKGAANFRRHLDRSIKTERECIEGLTMSSVQRRGATLARPQDVLG
jgi:hypothetical protein